mmetsp:Transcript_23976/g.52227  ORF Transcript_23976/g.52227 Transcript_23976/m.52227 type:complete len:240 (+) Transcript_23976:4623-5342(+)
MPLYHPPRSRSVLFPCRMILILLRSLHELEPIDSFPCTTIPSTLSLIGASSKTSTLPDETTIFPYTFEGSNEQEETRILAFLASVMFSPGPGTNPSGHVLGSCHSFNPGSINGHCTLLLSALGYLYTDLTILDASSFPIRVNAPLSEDIPDPVPYLGTSPSTVGSSLNVAEGQIALATSGIAIIPSQTILKQDYFWKSNRAILVHIVGRRSHQQFAVRRLRWDIWGPKHVSSLALCCPS